VEAVKDVVLPEIKEAEAMEAVADITVNSY
jgi:hypothetical protein